jgi:hypothetical protein
VAELLLVDFEVIPTRAIQVGLEFLGDEHLAGLAPFALADHQGGLAIPQEAVPDLERGDFGGPEAGGQERIQEGPGFGETAEAGQLLGGEVVDLALDGRLGTDSFPQSIPVS